MFFFQNILRSNDIDCFVPIGEDKQSTSMENHEARIKGRLDPTHPVWGACKGTTKNGNRGNSYKL